MKEIDEAIEWATYQCGSEERDTALAALRTMKWIAEKHAEDCCGAEYACVIMAKFHSFKKGGKR